MVIIELGFCVTGIALIEVLQWLDHNSRGV